MSDTSGSSQFDCGDALAALGDYLDGELPAEARAALADHLSGCANCARFGSAMSSVVASLDKLREPLSDEVAARIRRIVAQVLAE